MKYSKYYVSLAIVLALAAAVSAQAQLRYVTPDGGPIEPLEVSLSPQSAIGVLAPTVIAPDGINNDPAGYGCPCQSRAIFATDSTGTSTFWFCQFTRDGGATISSTEEGDTLENLGPNDPGGWVISFVGCMGLCTYHPEQINFCNEANHGHSHTGMGASGPGAWGDLGSASVYPSDWFSSYGTAPPFQSCN